MVPEVSRLLEHLKVVQDWIADLGLQCSHQVVVLALLLQYVRLKEYGYFQSMGLVADLEVVG